MSLSRSGLYVALPMPGTQASRRPDGGPICMRSSVPNSRPFYTPGILKLELGRHEKDAQYRGGISVESFGFPGRIAALATLACSSDEQLSVRPFSRILSKTEQYRRALRACKTGEPAWGPQVTCSACRDVFENIGASGAHIPMTELPTHSYMTTCSVNAMGIPTQVLPISCRDSVCCSALHGQPLLQVRILQTDAF